jgi:hypothetical protein
MAKGDTYSVHEQGKKLLDEYRGDRIYGNVFGVTKFDKLGAEEIVHFVTQSTFGDECTCKAAHRADCRHRQMVYIFKAANRLNTEWRYNYDEKVEPKKWRSTKS